MLDWLVERARLETMFLQYHALVAILLAARGPAARAYVRPLDAAVEKLSRLSFRRGCGR